MDSMWVVIHMARGETAAERVKERLESEGFMVRVRAVYKHMPPEENTFEVAALKSEAQEARDVLVDAGMV